MIEVLTKLGSDNITQIILAIIAFFAVGIVLKIRIKSKKDSNITNQKGNIVHGDNAGRDIRK